MIEWIKVANIMKKLEETGSTNDKLRILKENKDNELLRKVLLYALDTDKKFGMTKKSLKIREGDCKFEDFFELLDTLASENINDNLKRQANFFLGNMENEDVRSVMTQVLLKKLNCGVNIKTVNKVMNLIVTHDIQLASKWDGTLDEEVAVSLKLDGLRCSFLIENGKAIAKTRQNKIIQGMEDLTKCIEETFKNQNLFIDGELLAVNDEGLSSEDLFKKTSAIVNSKGIKKDLTFVAFDIVPLEDYINKSNNVPFLDRRELLEFYIGDNKPLIKLAPLYFITNDVDRINKKLDEVVNQGLEGLMISKLNGGYEFKRTKQLLKVKKFNEADVLVTDILEGEGRLEGTLGKIEVQFKYEGKIYTNNVGSGFNDSEREYFWNNKDELIGKIVTISYFEITSNDNGGYGFRFPTWKGKEYIRFDKQGIDDTNI